MNRIAVGAVSALLLASAGVFWWQGRAELEKGVPPPDLAAGPAADAPITLPSAGAHGRGAALPSAAAVARAKMSSEDKAFGRYDKKKDGHVTRLEVMATRVKAFQKLDSNHDNLLSFEEWAVKTSDKFGQMDANHDGVVTREEFHAWYLAHHKPRKPRPGCDAPEDRKAGRGAADAGAAGEDSDDDGNPAQ